MHFKCSLKKERLAQNVLPVSYGANNITATYSTSSQIFYSLLMTSFYKHCPAVSYVEIVAMYLCRNLALIYVLGK